MRTKELLNDLVFPYKQSGDGRELRFSLRSACQNLKFRNVVIIGDKPDFLSGVVHVPFAGMGGKYSNVFSRIMHVAADDNVTENFVLMNDDFFILRPYDPVPYLHRGTLGDWRDGYPLALRRKYFHRIRQTGNEIGNNRNAFEVHFPIVINKKRLLEICEKYALPNGLMLRTLYAFECGIEGEFCEDKKALTREDLERYSRGDFFSTSDDISQTPEFLDTMTRLFPTPCRFEI